MFSRFFILLQKYISVLSNSSTVNAVDQISSTTMTLRDFGDNDIAEFIDSNIVNTLIFKLNMFNIIILMIIIVFPIYFNEAIRSLCDISKQLGRQRTLDSEGSSHWIIWNFFSCLWPLVESSTWEK